MLCTISLSRNVRNVNMSYFSWKIFPHLKGYTKHQSIGHMVYSYLQPISQTSFVSCCFSYQDWGPFETMHYLCWTAKSRSNFSRKSYLSITLQKTNSYRYLYYFMPHMYVLFHTIDLIDQSHVNWELEGGVNILMTANGIEWIQLVWGIDRSSPVTFSEYCVRSKYPNYSYTLAANALAPWVSRPLAGMILTVSSKWFNVFMNNDFCNLFAISVSTNSKNCKYHVVFSKQNQSANS